MKSKKAAIAIGLWLGGAALAYGQKHPVQVGDGYVASLGAKMQSKAYNRVSPAGKAAVSQAQVRTIPNWSSSFTYQGTNYPYTMVGTDPVKGGTTTVPTSMIPLSFFFDDYIDENGNNIVIESTPILNGVLNSPNFQKAGYPGLGDPLQFGDAIQRAEFFSIEKKDWHTLLQAPRMLTPVQIEVPPGLSTVYQLRSGAFFAIVDLGFLNSQLNTIVQLEPLSAQELPIAIAHNILSYDTTPDNCCILGFHTAYEAGVQDGRTLLQTFVYAAWVDAGIYNDPSVADVVTLSHEISEWMNDPFINNLVPAWQFPDGSGFCQDDLETGDPLEVLLNSAYPVTIGGYIYHPQNEALLPWFSRQVPNKLSLGGAYSYPNTSLLTGPSLACKATSKLTSK